MGSVSTGKTLLVATLLCIVCSFFVSTSVVLLKSAQDKNKSLDLKKNLLVSAGLISTNSSEKEITDSFSKLKPLLVDLNLGELIERENYDQRKAVKIPTLSKRIVKDIAGIKVRELYSKIYLAYKNNVIDMLILPLYGKGLWSTMYGFLALDSDLNTIRGFGFYEHGETPGLGGEIDNPNWKKLWVGKQLFSIDGKLMIKVMKGKVDRGRPSAKYQVDGISGATLTSIGVSNTVRYWMGLDGYQKFLTKIKNKEIRL